MLPLLTVDGGAVAGACAAVVAAGGGCAADACADGCVDEPPLPGQPTNGASDRFASYQSCALLPDDFGTRSSLVALTGKEQSPIRLYGEW